MQHSFRLLEHTRDIIQAGIYSDQRLVLFIDSMSTFVDPKMCDIDRENIQGLKEEIEKQEFKKKKVIDTRVYCLECYRIKSSDLIDSAIKLQDMPSLPSIFCTPLTTLQIFQEHHIFTKEVNIALLIFQGYGTKDFNYHPD